MYYLIQNTLIPCTEQEIKENEPCVAILSREEVLNHPVYSELDIYPQFLREDVRVTRAFVSYDNLSGTFSVPDRTDLMAKPHCFSFIIFDKTVLIFNDKDNFASSLVTRIKEERIWKYPSLERFLYDFLELLIENDLPLLETVEKQLNQIEDGILKEEEPNAGLRINKIRGDLLDLQAHYRHLADLSQELEENENGFFDAENTHYFRMFTERVLRLSDLIVTERDYTVQLRDLLQSRVDAKQNNIMTILTVVTTVLTPLTLITGWYGMNFRYMPELDSPLAYPAVILLSISIAVLCLLYFHKKKWI